MIQHGIGVTWLGWRRRSNEYYKRKRKLLQKHTILFVDGSLEWYEGSKIACFRDTFYHHLILKLSFELEFSQNFQAKVQLN